MLMTTRENAPFALNTISECTSSNNGRTLSQRPPRLIKSYLNYCLQRYTIMELKTPKLRPSLPPLDVLDKLDNRLNWSELARRSGMEPSRLTQCRRQLQGKSLSNDELATLADQLHELAALTEQVSNEVRPAPSP